MKSPLLSYFGEPAVAKELKKTIQKEQIKIQLKGLAGSAFSILSATIIRQSNQPNLFILNDKENASYFLNDIESLLNNEIFFSTYICHPSMANDNLSGIALQIYLINYIQKNYKNNLFSYRFVFLPETIGSIAYLSKRFKKLKKKMFIGFNLSCVGDEKAYSVISSRNINSMSNQALKSALIKKNNV